MDKFRVQRITEYISENRLGFVYVPQFWNTETEEWENFPLVDEDEKPLDWP
jgi:hypothetical protein